MNSEPFFPDAGGQRICDQCGAEFDVLKNARRKDCPACQRLRRLEYGAAYRQNVRDLRARLLDRFGGKAPTRDQIFHLLRLRKGSKD